MEATWVLRTKPRELARAADALNQCSLSPALTLKFLNQVIYCSLYRYITDPLFFLTHFLLIFAYRKLKHRYMEIKLGLNIFRLSVGNFTCRDRKVTDLL